MLKAAWKKNDKQARIFIITVSIVVFAAVVILGRVKLNLDPGFDVHIFAKINAGINTVVSLLLLAGLAAVKNRKLILLKM